MFTRQQFPTELLTGPGLVTAAARQRLGFPAQTGHRHHLWARRTWTWVTEQQTGVTAVRFEPLLTDGAAGVRHEPGVGGGVLHFPTVTQVPVGGCTRWILRSAFGAGPGQLLLSKVLVCDRRHQEDRVSSPFLHTGQVEEGETARTAPHRLCSLDRGDADEASQGSRLKQFIHKLACPLQTRAVSSALLAVGGEGGLQDLSSLPLFALHVFVVVFVGGGGAKAALDQSLSSRHVGLPDLLEARLHRNHWGRALRWALLVDRPLRSWPLSLFGWGS